MLDTNSDDLVTVSNRVFVRITDRAPYRLVFSVHETFEFLESICTFLTEFQSSLPPRLLSFGVLQLKDPFLQFINEAHMTDYFAELEFGTATTVGANLQFSFE